MVQDTGQPILNLRAERVALGPLRRDLAPRYARWANDFALLRTLAGPPRPLRLNAQLDQYDRAVAGRDSVSFTIYELAGRNPPRPLGATSLVDLDDRAGSAEFVIYLGEAAARGRGFGTETTRLMLAYAFEQLGLRSVWLRVYAYNLAGRRVYERCGFVEIGRRREAHAMGGRLWDVVLMECRRPALQPAAKPAPDVRLV